MVTHIYNSCYSEIIPDHQCQQEGAQKQECECNFSVALEYPDCKTKNNSKSLIH